MECLTIYSGAHQSGFTTVLVLYRGEGESLELCLEEGGVQTTCRLRTYDADELCPFDIARHQPINKIIITGDQLKEAFSEMDWSSEYVQIWLSPSEFRLSSDGQQGACEIEYPAGNLDLFEEFFCPSTLHNMFKIALLIPAVKSLNVAAKTQLRMNALGLLNMRHMIRLENNKMAFTEFNIVSDVEYDD
jgi:cell cycle checkpoint protein